jgi:ferredoxin-NADP reductase
VLLPVFSPFAPARLVSARPAATAQATLIVEPREGFVAAYRRPGQFCKMRLGDAEGVFAMFSAPGAPLLRFLVRVGGPDGGDAADRLAEQPDATPIEMTLPAGEGFALERARGKALYFVATGTGVAPVRAAIEAVLAERGAYGAIHLDHGVRSQAHLAIGDDIARWRAAGVDVRVVTSELLHDGRLRGVTVQESLRARVPDLSDAAVVAVGQPQMVESLRAEVLAMGGAPELFLTNL